MISPPPTYRYHNAEYIVRRLQQQGHQALLAGGCVRDLILGTSPKDYDVATSARPEDLERIFRHTVPVGRDFGVMLVVMDGTSYEVATFRSEDSYSDGRHPDRVEYSDATEDARRRDFTINGMFWDPVAGQLIDTVGGEAGLRDRQVRAIGNPRRRFREDHLRLVRAIRFAARLGFEIEPATRRALEDNVHLTTEVAAERLQQELRVILTDRNPAAALRLMRDMGMLFRIFPELESMEGCEQPENYHPEGDVFVHTMLAVEKLGPHPDFEVALATLLHDVGKPPANEGRSDMRFPEHERIGQEITHRVCRRLRLPNKEIDRIGWLVKYHMYFKDAEKMNESTLKNLFAEPGFEQLCEVVRADALASWGRLDDLEYVLEKRQELSEEEISPPRLIDGHDLIQRGYQPGPDFGKILDEVREKQLEGEISERDDALEEAERIADRIDAARQKEEASST
jgi:poly(A) polymerase